MIPGNTGTRGQRRTAGILIATGILPALALVRLWAWVVMIRMPGRSIRGALAPLTPSEEEIAERLELDIKVLADAIGERNLQRRYDALIRAACYIEDALAKMGYAPKRQTFHADGKPVWNVWAEAAGRRAEKGILLVGAHYDTLSHSPGANDNGTGVAATLELARAFARSKPERTLRFVFFVNEEDLHFMTKEMGSLVHAKECRKEGLRIHGMLCLETLGCYKDDPGSQKYPPPLSFFYPSTADFVCFVGNLKSRSLVHEVIGAFRRHASIPSEGIAATELLQDIRRSDHYPFWRAGYPALMVTDTANFRYEHYHQPTDLIGEIRFDGLARVVAGLVKVLQEL